MRRRNDARLWAQLSDVLQRGLGQDMDTDKAERFARVLVAIVRRDQHPHTGTWAPGDPLPDPPPQRVFDVDGAVWEHQQAGHGCYRMSERDRAKYADASADHEGVRVWPDLLDTEGPLTAIRMRDTRA